MSTAEDIRKLILKQRTTEEIACELRISARTVTRHRQKLGLDHINCACGRPLVHTGWCAVRRAKVRGVTGARLVKGYAWSGSE